MTNKIIIPGELAIIAACLGAYGIYALIVIWIMEIRKVMKMTTKEKMEKIWRKWATFRFKAHCWKLNHPGKVIRAKFGRK